jgi:hypothetical protein
MPKCHCRTNEGYKCKRNATEGSFCFQHANSKSEKMRCNSILRKCSPKKKPGKRNHKSPKKSRK